VLSPSDDNVDQFASTVHALGRNVSVEIWISGMTVLLNNPSKLVTPILSATNCLEPVANAHSPRLGWVIVARLLCEGALLSDVRSQELR
jgi:hypothetical protein